MFALKRQLYGNTGPTTDRASNIFTVHLVTYLFIHTTIILHDNLIIHEGKLLSSIKPAQYILGRIKQERRYPIGSHLRRDGNCNEQYIRQDTCNHVYPYYAR